jgi:hypothetical protein
MDWKKELRAFIQEGYLHFLPHLSIDCAVFGFHDNQLKILLVKWKNLEGWCLPGGYVKRSEPVDEAAQRILEERTGIGKLFLQQFTRLAAWIAPKKSASKTFRQPWVYRLEMITGWPIGLSPLGITRW